MPGLVPGIHVLLRDRGIPQSLINKNEPTRPPISGPARSAVTVATSRKPAVTAIFTMRVSAK
jgi:hypothetical protein